MHGEPQYVENNFEYLSLLQFLNKLTIQNQALQPGATAVGS